MRTIILLVGLAALTFSDLIPTYDLSQDAIDYISYRSKPAPPSQLTYTLSSVKILFIEVNNFRQRYPGVKQFRGMDVNARTQFYQCLGTSYYACMNLFNILDTSDPDFINAFDYTRTYMGLEFMCNAGFEEVVTQWSCLHGIQTTSAYNTCMNNFTYNTVPTNFCSMVDTTGKCLNNVYLNACKDNGAGWFGCENFRFTFDQTCWGLRCTVGMNY
ncbi:unnamed protein product [Strongylus vulgaris]|uniref:Secreted protein n=1 Tax=Strongylus vulgaris TaxID=40348 RepID=A0A3P7IQF6_STRVU|nr:unnamed protein product [Strongylus vulgaris]